MSSSEIDSGMLIVPMPDDARAFVVDSFVRSWADAARGGNDNIPPTELAQFLFRDATAPLRRYIDVVLARSTTYVAMAEKSTSAYIGWMSANADTLEYVYVKRAARRLGIARDLMKHHGQPLTRQALVTWPWTSGLTRCR